ncbi:hypothetical protein JGH11_06165 [Dysgonomonas sp. Marseille-P4677]|uniref:hypothetical protein n=1 Tax=Dysgonomonas sp. Marseille-P4677 TaxID=2364790 RepID=UPI001911760A|nr:hypothetical protein [Dysgonomonas sp. Marseille-P4677]MBK5720451.1 hypothetical protein [Dysgonomonas sp. Marseille-P4677]
MNANRYILLLILMVLFPIFASSQTYRPPTKREAEQIGKKTYILSNGDTTKVVNTVGSGLRDSYSNFLFRKVHTTEVDSIFSDTESDYSSLEEAALDIDKLLREVELEKKLNSGRNDALAFRLARDNRALKRKERTAAQTADSLLKQKDPSVQELTSIYVGFEGKPTYYINGVEVSHSLVNQLYPQEVIKREMRVSNTVSGNPYGEVWIQVAEKTLNRIKIPVYLTSDYIHESTASATVVDPTIIKKRPEPAPLPVVRREITADGKKIDVLVTQPEMKDQKDENTTNNRTKVLTRTINDQKVETNGNPVPTSTPTYNNVRSSQPVVRRAQPTLNKDTYNSKQQISNTEKDSAPKKSVRKIKERQQNKD